MREKGRITVITRSRRHETPQYCDVRNTFQSSNDDALDPFGDGLARRCTRVSGVRDCLRLDDVAGRDGRTLPCAHVARRRDDRIFPPRFARVRFGRRRDVDRPGSYIARHTTSGVNGASSASRRSLRFVTILSSTTMRSNRNVVVVVFRRCWAPLPIGRTEVFDCSCDGVHTARSGFLVDAHARTADDRCEQLTAREQNNIEYSIGSTADDDGHRTEHVPRRGRRSVKCPENRAAAGTGPDERVCRTGFWVSEAWRGGIARYSVFFFFKIIGPLGSLSYRPTGPVVGGGGGGARDAAA